MSLVFSIENRLKQKCLRNYLNLLLLLLLYYYYYIIIIILLLLYYYYYIIIIILLLLLLLLLLYYYYCYFIIPSLYTVYLELDNRISDSRPTNKVGRPVQAPAQGQQGNRVWTNGWRPRRLLSGSIRVVAVQVGRMGYVPGCGGNGNSRNVSCSKPSLRCRKRPWEGALYKWLTRSASDAMHMALYK